MKQGFERYSLKSDNYAKYRYEIPKETIDFLYSHCFIDDKTVIADIASGTGRFTKLLLSKKNIVYGVEKNNEMRKKGEEILSSYDNFISIKGEAEKTELKNKSIDLITVCQGFQWFDKEKTLVEFKRILKDNGKVFILWDDFIKDYNDFSLEYGKLLCKFRNKESIITSRKVSRKEMIQDFFKNNEYETLCFTHETCENFETLKGATLSASFTPNPNEKNYIPFIFELEEIFNRYKVNNKVLIAFKCLCFLGKL